MWHHTCLSFPDYIAAFGILQWIHRVHQLSYLAGVKILQEIIIHDSIFYQLLWPEKYNITLKNWESHSVHAHNDIYVEHTSGSSLSISDLTRSYKFTAYIWTNIMTYFCNVGHGKQGLKMFETNAWNINLDLNEVNWVRNENNYTGRSFMFFTFHPILLEWLNKEAELLWNRHPYKGLFDWKISQNDHGNQRHISNSSISSSSSLFNNTFWETQIIQVEWKGDK